MRELPKTQRLASCGLAVRDDQVLLVRSGAQWLLPGGRVEHGEHPADTAVREVAEETGFQVAVDHFVEVVSRHRQIRDKDVHNVVLVYQVTVIGGELRHEIDGGTQEARWVALSDLDDLSLFSGTVDILRRYLDR